MTKNFSFEMLRVKCDAFTSLGSRLRVCKRRELGQMPSMILSHSRHAVVSCSLNPNTPSVDWRKHYPGVLPTELSWSESACFEDMLQCDCSQCSELQWSEWHGDGGPWLALWKPSNQQQWGWLAGKRRTVLKCESPVMLKLGRRSRSLTSSPGWTHS